MVFDYITIFIYGIVAGLMASIPLGPIGVLCVQRTLSNSHRAGFVSGLGAATADTVFAGLAIFAMSWITGFISRYEVWVEVVGGLLIMLFGFSIFFKKPKRPSGVKTKGKAATSDLSNYFSVLFLTLPNPAYFLVFVTIFAAMGVGGADSNSVQKWMLILGVLTGAGGWWFILTWVVNKFRKKFTMRSLWWLNKISGGMIVLLGAFAVISVIYKLVKMLVETGAVKL